MLYLDFNVQIRVFYFITMGREDPPFFCMEAFTDTLPIVCNSFMYGSIYRHFTNSGFMYGSIYRHFTNSVQQLDVWNHLQTLYQQCVMDLCMEAFTDTLPIVCNGFMYGSIYRHITNSVQWIYVWKHLQTLYQQWLYVWKHLQTLYQQCAIA